MFFIVPILIGIMALPLSFSFLSYQFILLRGTFCTKSVGSSVISSWVCFYLGKNIFDCNILETCFHISSLTFRKSSNGRVAHNMSGEDNMKVRGILLIRWDMVRRWYLLPTKEGKVAKVFASLFTSPFSLPVSMGGILSACVKDLESCISEKWVEVCDIPFFYLNSLTSS